LTKTASVDSGIQGEDSEVRREHSRPGIDKLEALDVAASPGPGTERLGPCADVRAEDIDELNLLRHQRVEAFRIPVLPRIPNRLFAAQHRLGVGVMADWPAFFRRVHSLFGQLCGVNDGRSGAECRLPLRPFSNVACRCPARVRELVSAAGAVHGRLMCDDGRLRCQPAHLRIGDLVADNFAIRAAPFTAGGRFVDSTRRVPADELFGQEGGPELRVI
jgi:hypothetical protein